MLLSGFLRLAAGVRLLGFGTNPLRRDCDRVESVVLRILVLAATVTAAAGLFAGAQTHRQLSAQAAAQSGSRQQVTVTVLRSAFAPVMGGVETSGQPVGQVQVPGRWCASGQTCVTAPVLVDSGTRAGDRVPIWVDRHGQQAAAPSTPTHATVAALLAGCGTTAAGFAFLAGCYAVIRRRLDRTRADQWEMAWASFAAR